MKNTAIFFGSSTGNTEAAAKTLAGIIDADVYNVSKADASKLNDYNNLIFASSTWGIGDLQDDFETFISVIENAELNDKVVAIFGYGDGTCYADSFVDAIGTIYNAVKDKGCKVVGHVDTDGYEFGESTAIVDGKFVGLPLDEENQAELSDDRLSDWAEELKKAFK
jgi:flavodoxin I